MAPLLKLVEAFVNVPPPLKLHFVSTIFDVQSSFVGTQNHKSSLNIDIQSSLLKPQHP